MKKTICCILAAAVLMLTGCGDKTPQTIELSFDKDTAYFTGSTVLYAIAGETPADGDAVERATVIIRSGTACKMRLIAVFEEGSVPPDGLMIAVDGAIKAFTNNVELYASASPETEKSLSVAIYLRHDTGEQTQETTLRFKLELSGEAANG